MGPAKNKSATFKKIILTFFSIAFCLMLLELGLRLGGFIFVSWQEYSNKRSLLKKDSYRIMCLGESTTAGQYPFLLEEILNRRNIGVKFSVIDKGANGINTTGILLHLENNLNTYKPDMVIAMMGNNDIEVRYYKDIPEANTAIFQRCSLYRFIRLIYMHITHKLKDEDIYGLDKTGLKGGVALRRAVIDTGNKFSSGEETLKKAIELNPRNEAAYIELGRLYLQQERFPEAEGILKQAVTLNSKNDEAYAILGRLYRQQGMFPEAEGILKQAIALNPKSDAAYAGLGWLYRQQGMFPKSEESFKQAIALNSRNDGAYTGLGRLYRQQDMLSEAEISLKKAIELNPRNEAAYNELGRLYSQQERFPEAEGILKQAIALNPSNDEAYTRLEWLYKQQGKLLEPKMPLNKAMVLNPKNDKDYTNLGRFYRKQGKLLESEISLKQAIALNPKNDEAYAILGRLYRQQDMLSEAEISLKKAIELNPRNEAAYIELGRLYLYQLPGMLPEAEKLFKKVLTFAPNNNIAYIELGEFCRKKGKISEAEKYFKQAIALNSDNDDAKDQARRALESLYIAMNRIGVVPETDNTYRHITINNYRKLKAILDREGIRLVCVQYPMRSVGPLEKIFEGDRSVIFVDNKRLFKEAVMQKGYKEYFKDMFAGDFGHCTYNGNKLLAENIADAILKGAFGK